MGAGYTAWQWSAALVFLAILRFISGFMYTANSPKLLSNAVDPESFETKGWYYWSRIFFFVVCLTILQLILPWFMLGGSIFGFKRRVNSARALLDRAARAIGMQAEDAEQRIMFDNETTQEQKGLEIGRSDNARNVASMDTSAEAIIRT